MPVYSDFNSAYIGCLGALSEHGVNTPSVGDPTSVGSDFGSRDRPFRELLSYSFTLTDPRSRLLANPFRPINVPFAVANSIWTLAGSDSLAFIKPYNGHGSRFSDDQRTFHGAHGKRLLDCDGTNQLTAALIRLRADPQSRRAVAVVIQPMDAVSQSRDIPCLVSLQFLQRDGRLHCVANMRSQSAAMVLPYDVFAFTFIQECLAVELGVQVGCFYHNSASFHYYMDEEALVRQLLESPLPDDTLSGPAPVMPTSPSPLAAVSALLRYEQVVRDSLEAGQQASKVNAPSLPEYWCDLAYVLACGLCRAANVDEHEIRRRLSPYWASHLHSPCRHSLKGVSA